MKQTFVMLIAEDDISDLKLLEHAVAHLDQKVDLRVTRDGDEMISYLRGDDEFSDRARHPLPDLIMMDLKMPRVTGFEVLRWLQHQPDLAHIPRVVLSGSDVVNDVTEVLELGAYTFFTKPNGLLKFRELLEYVVGYWTRAESPGAPVPARRQPGRY